MFSSKCHWKHRQRREAPPEIRFAIVGNPRTGSSHLASLLDSHPDVACWDGELFNEGQEFDQSACPDPRDFLFQRVFDVGATAVGFKLLREAIRRIPAAWTMLRELNIRLIHCVRRNGLSSYVSWKLATLNAAFTCYEGSYRITQFQMNPDELIRWIAAVEKADNEIQENAHRFGIPILTTEYEELCNSQDRILDFLEVHRHPLHSRLKRQRDLPLCDIIENLEETRQRLESIGRANWLDSEPHMPQKGRAA